MPYRATAAPGLMFLLALACPGCRSVGENWLNGMKHQYERAVQEMKADMAVLDSNNDVLDAFTPVEAKQLRAARADMGR